MTNKYLSERMILPIILVLLSSVVNLSTSCCEKNVRIATFVDAAIDLMSKVKSVNISCTDGCDINDGRPMDCMDLYKRGYNKSGVYTIFPVSRLASLKDLQVFCDMEGGGWTVIQKRGNFGRRNNFFEQDWQSYKKGFGDLEKDFWLGNDNIFAITNQRLYSVRFALEDKQQNKAYADYDSFWIDDELNKYALHISAYSGTAGDSMAAHNNMKFITKEDPKSKSFTKCGIKYLSGWWYTDCYNANLNGLYNSEEHGIIWFPWKMKMEHLPRVEIKIKPFLKY